MTDTTNTSIMKRTTHDAEQQEAVLRMPLNLLVVLFDEERHEGESSEIREHEHDRAVGIGRRGRGLRRGRGCGLVGHRQEDIKSTRGSVYSRIAERTPSRPVPEALTPP